MRTAVILLLASVLHIGGMAIATWDEETRAAFGFDDIAVYSPLPLHESGDHSSVKEMPRRSGEMRILFSSPSLPFSLGPESALPGAAAWTALFTDAMEAGSARGAGGMASTGCLPGYLLSPWSSNNGSFSLFADEPPFRTGSAGIQPFHAGEGMAWQVTGSIRSECGYAMPFRRQADLLASQARALRRGPKPSHPAADNPCRGESIPLFTGFTF